MCNLGLRGETPARSRETIIMINNMYCYDNEITTNNSNSNNNNNNNKYNDNNNNDDIELRGLTVVTYVAYSNVYHHCMWLYIYIYIYIYIHLFIYIYIYILLSYS